MLPFPSPDIGMFGRRQRHVRGHRIPVTIARTGAAEGAAAVIDDFVDDEAPIGQCSCCTVRAKLQQAVREQAQRQPAGRITIQTEADIVPILRTFVAERALGSDFYVECAPPLEGDRFTLTEPVPLSWDAFSRFITALTTLRGADLLHACGLLNIEGYRGPVAVEFMGHLAARPIELEAWPHENRASQLEFVTRNIDEAAVRVMLNAVRAFA